jgi:hypothetical protein
MKAQEWVLDFAVPRMPSDHIVSALTRPASDSDAYALATIPSHAHLRGSQGVVRVTAQREGKTRTGVDSCSGTMEELRISSRQPMLSPGTHNESGVLYQAKPACDR